MYEKGDFLKIYFLCKMGNFHCYLSFLEGIVKAGEGLIQKTFILGRGGSTRHET